MPSKFQTLVYAAAKRIPRGRVATYRAVAEAIGKPYAVRAVGNALNKNPFTSIPCHRVVRSDGTVGGYARGIKTKIKILRREGVKIYQSGLINHSQILKNMRMK